MTQDFSERANRKDRKSKFVAPSSPWQLAINTRMEEMPISTRDLSDRIWKQSKIRLEHVKLWGWIRHKLGYPGRTFTLEMNHAIAKALDIPTQELDRLLDLSRAFSPSTLKDRGLYALRRIIENSPRKQWTKAQILAEIDALQ
jgi:hypothetical protein